MCTGAELLPLLLAAGGTATSTIAQQRNLRAQDEQAARGIMQQAEIQREASRKVGENIERIRTSNPDAERRAAQNDFMAALRDAQPGQPLEPAGAVSSRFSEDLGRTQADVGQESGQLAGRLARVDAPALQRLREGEDAANTASELSVLQGNSNAADFLTRLRVASQQPNPFVIGAGQAAGAFGSALAGRAQPPGKLKPLKGRVLTDTPVFSPGVLNG